MGPPDTFVLQVPCFFPARRFFNSHFYSCLCLKVFRNLGFPLNKLNVLLFIPLYSLIFYFFSISFVFIIPTVLFIIFIVVLIIIVVIISSLVNYYLDFCRFFVFYFFKKGCMKFLIKLFLKILSLD